MKVMQILLAVLTLQLSFAHASTEISRTSESIIELQQIAPVSVNVDENPSSDDPSWAAGLESAPPIWIELFRRILCELYEQFGGDCDNLNWGQDVTVPVDQIRNHFNLNGLPPGGTDDLVDDLIFVETLLASSQSPLSPAETAYVQSLVDDIQAAIASS